MMLSSKEDKERGGRKKNGKRKNAMKNGRGGNKRNNFEWDDEEANVNEEEDFATPSLGLSTSQFDEEEEEVVDCITANRNAIESQVQKYIPKCTRDGNYEQIQCHKVRHIFLMIIICVSTKKFLRLYTVSLKNCT